MRHLNRVLQGAALVIICMTVTPANADLSAFIAAVGFDDEANLEGAPGVGLRWGKSSGVLGGETSLMIARPDREVGSASEAATAIFYEGRILLNIPLGEIKPFVGVGFGRIMTLPGKLPGSNVEALSDTETNSAFSYGAGVRYALNERIDGRVDIRQYQVFSVTGAVTDAVIDEIADDVGGGDLLPGRTKERTVTYGEVSVGVVFRF
jgi:opacity protein-like surface antigen